MKSIKFCNNKKYSIKLKKSIIKINLKKLNLVIYYLKSKIIIRGINITEQKSKLIIKGININEQKSKIIIRGININEQKNKIIIRGINSNEQKKNKNNNQRN